MGITGLAGSMVQAPAFQTACDSWTGTVRGWLMAVAVMVVVGLSATLNDSMVFGLGTQAVPGAAARHLPGTTAGVGTTGDCSQVYGSDVGRGIKFFHSLLVLIGLYLSWLLYYWNFYGPNPW